MRNRREQRRLRRTDCKEEKLDFRDKCGIKDPTPYEAVKRIVAKERIMLDIAELKKMKENEHSTHSAPAKNTDSTT